ncbi:MAG TPA: hypothetical protein VN915_04125 [Elusimicrobiota bacterium]|nr:hypothetical protein [Elusimicrobiota bacterium]
MTRTTLSSLLILALVLQTGCGTILYPERRGQKATHIDAGVAVLDGIGLLFFILPGVIAFAVDFSTGCIYYAPSGKSASSSDAIEKAKFDLQKGAHDLERAIKEKTGASVNLKDPRFEVFELNSLDDLPGRFAAAQGELKGPGTSAAGAHPNGPGRLSAFRALYRHGTPRRVGLGARPLGGDGQPRSGSLAAPAS